MSFNPLLFSQIHKSVLFLCVEHICVDLLPHSGIWKRMCLYYCTYDQSLSKEDIQGLSPPDADCKLVAILRFQSCSVLSSSYYMNQRTVVLKRFARLKCRIYPPHHSILKEYSTESLFFTVMNSLPVVLKVAPERFKPVFQVSSCK